MIRLIVIILLCLALFIPVANAEEKPMNILSCRSGTTTMLTASKELVLFAFELKGIDQDLNEDKVHENYTHMCVGTIRIMGGEQISTGYCKYMAPDGDFFIVSFDGLSGGKPLPWEYFYGTGKWKGVKGGGTARTITTGKPIAEGTFQSCMEISGTYELPQKKD
jgi:hypothetical protein